MAQSDFGQSSLIGCRLTWLPWECVCRELSLGCTVSQHHHASPGTGPGAVGTEVFWTEVCCRKLSSYRQGHGLGQQEAELSPAGKMRMLIDNQLLQPCCQGNKDGAVGQQWALPHVPPCVRTSASCRSSPALHQSQCLCPESQPLGAAALDETCHLHP